VSQSWARDSYIASAGRDATLIEDLAESKRVLPGGTDEVTKASHRDALRRVLQLSGDQGTQVLDRFSREVDPVYLDDCSLAYECRHLRRRYTV
jgi:hypothetical protein